MWGLPTCSDPGPAEMKGCLSPASGPPRPQCLQLEGQQSCCSWLKPVAGLSPPPHLMSSNPPFPVLQRTLRPREGWWPARGHTASWRLSQDSPQSLWTPSPGLIPFPRNLAAWGLTLGSWRDPGLGRTVGSCVCLKSRLNVD